MLTTEKSQAIIDLEKKFYQDIETLNKVIADSKLANQQKAKINNLWSTIKIQINHISNYISQKRTSNACQETLKLITFLSELTEILQEIEDRETYKLLEEHINNLGDLISNLIKYALIANKNPNQDAIITIPNVTWNKYENITETIGETSWCKVSYWDGVLELMAVGIKHENLNRNINSLIEKYCDDQGIPYKLVGSAEFRGQKAGKQPDSGYFFSKESVNPDLALEINISSGSIKDLELYKELSTKEVWIWDGKKNKLTFYFLEDGDYQVISSSYFLEKITPELIERYLLLIEKDDFNLSLYKEEFINEIKSKSA